MEFAGTLKPRHAFTLKDVPPAAFIEAFAERLKAGGKVTIPEWADYAKTSCAKQLAPLDEDWLYTRMAALVRKVYIYPFIGVGTLSRMFGGAKKRGHNPLTFQRASRKAIRYALAELEKLGLVEVVEEHDENEALVVGGRAITSQGRRECDMVAREVGEAIAAKADLAAEAEEEDDEEEAAADAAAADDEE